MDTRQLAAFVAVVEKKSFSQAAARLGVTQPAISLQIRSLEERLGQTLLDRSGRRVEPTEAGLRLYRGAPRMLALEVALAGTSPVRTFVFDEVDSGVGGKAAVEVGRRLAALAASAQVLVVTHLPQVAAYADRHVVVEKASDGSVTTSGLSVLDATGRERELSRMFAGMEESETALAHARELLEKAQKCLAVKLGEEVACQP